MIRKAFLMALKLGNQGEYERRHNPIWPELQEVLRQHGIHSYSIFLDQGTDKLFAYAEGSFSSRLNERTVDRITGSRASLH